MSVTLRVSKLLKSRLLGPVWNNSLISFTLAVLKWLKSRSVRSEQPLNIAAIFSTSSVTKYSMCVIFFKFAQ